MAGHRPINIRGAGGGGRVLGGLVILLAPGRVHGLDRRVPGQGATKVGMNQLLHRLAQAFEFERLAQEREEASLAGGGRFFDRGEARHQDRRQRADRDQLLEHANARGARQVEVEDREVKAVPLRKFGRFLAVGRRRDFPAMASEEFAEAAPQRIIILDQQNSERLRHG